MQVGDLFFLIPAFYVGYPIGFTIFQMVMGWVDTRASNKEFALKEANIKVGGLVRSLYTEPRLWGVVVESNRGIYRVLLDDGRLASCTIYDLEVVCK